MTLLTFGLKVKMFCLNLAELLMALKVIQTVLTFGYMFFVARVWVWYSAIANPSNGQTTAFVSVLGIATAIVGLYTGNLFHRGDWENFQGVKLSTTRKLELSRLPPGSQPPSSQG